MTIIDLIEKLRKESLRQAEAGKEPGGEYMVLHGWYNDMLNLNLTEAEIFNQYFRNISGFIWGLKAARFITTKELMELQIDLNWICDRFYGTNDQTP